MPAIRKPDSPQLTGNSEQFWNKVVGENLMQGRYTPRFNEFNQEINETLTGTGSEGERIPGIVRAMNLAGVAGGGGSVPAGAVASGIGRGAGKGFKEWVKSISEGLLRNIDEDIAAKTGNATAALRQAALKAPENIAGFQRLVKPKEVLDATQKTGAFVIDDTGRIIQVSAHSPEAHSNLVRISTYGENAGITLPANITTAMVNSINQIRPSRSLGQIVINDSFGKQIELKDLHKLIK